MLCLDHAVCVCVVLTRWGCLCVVLTRWCLCSTDGWCCLCRADHEDQEIMLFNRCMLPSYYGLLRLCCVHSRHFTRQLAQHQNIQWAFKNITPYPSQYSAVSTLHVPYSAVSTTLSFTVQCGEYTPTPHSTVQWVHPISRTVHPISLAVSTPSPLQCGGYTPTPRSTVQWVHRPTPHSVALPVPIRIGCSLVCPSQNWV